MTQKNAIEFECHVFYSALCYIQAQRKSLKNIGIIIKNTADLSKMLQYLTFWSIIAIFVLEIVTNIINIIKDVCSI